MAHADDFKEWTIADHQRVVPEFHFCRNCRKRSEFSYCCSWRHVTVEVRNSIYFETPTVTVNNYGHIEMQIPTLNRLAVTIFFQILPLGCYGTIVQMK